MKELERRAGAPSYLRSSNWRLRVAGYIGLRWVTLGLGNQEVYTVSQALWLQKSDFFPLKTSNMNSCMIYQSVCSIIKADTYPSTYFRIFYIYTYSQYRCITIFSTIPLLLGIHLVSRFFFPSPQQWYSNIFVYRICILVLLFLWASFPEAESCNRWYVYVFASTELDRLLFKHSQDHSSVWESRPSSLHIPQL